MMDKKKLGFLCSSCARDLGGKNREGVFVKMAVGECSECKKWKSIASPEDWQLDPDGDYDGMRCVLWE